MHRSKISHSETISSCSKAVLIEDTAGILRRIFPIYRKVASSNTFHLEADASFFRLLMKGIFDPYVL